MSRRFIRVAFSACTLFLAACFDEATPGNTSAMSVTRTLGGQEIDGYQRAYEPGDLQFPADHGAHPEYKNEWWYVTGNLETEEGQSFGFQFTLFRSSLAPEPNNADNRASTWATSQAFMAHVALSDIDSERFYHDERFSRGALGLAGAEPAPFRIWLDNWTISQAAAPDSGCSGCFSVQLQAASNDFELVIALETDREPIPHGDRGLSAKSATPGNASYYYSFTRLAASGRIRVEGKTYEVHGQAWFDHEWSTSALEEHQQGWDWFSLQLDDGSDLMLFQLRHESDPELDYRSGTLLRPDGSIHGLAGNDFAITPSTTWQSAATGAVYPDNWDISVPGHQLDLAVRSRLPAQEVNASFRYWEGAVSIQGQDSGAPVSGVGYAELTGYDDQGISSK